MLGGEATCPSGVHSAIVRRILSSCQSFRRMTDSPHHRGWQNRGKRFLLSVSSSGCRVMMCRAAGEATPGQPPSSTFCTRSTFYAVNHWPLPERSFVRAAGKHADICIPIQNLGSDNHPVCRHDHVSFFFMSVVSSPEQRHH